MIRKRGGQPSSDGPLSNFDLITSLLPKASKRVSDSDEQPFDSETDDVLRKTTCLLLRLTYVEAQKQLESLQQELEILQNAPPSPQLPSSSDLDGRDRQRESDYDLWTLDSPLMTSGPNCKGPLLDSSGKVSFLHSYSSRRVSNVICSLFDRLLFCPLVQANGRAFKLKFLAQAIDCQQCRSTSTWK